MKDEVVEFRNALEKFGADNVDSLTKDFEKMVTEEISPTELWTCNSHGAFKECYDVREPNFIIKFASSANPTTIEEDTLQIAINAGFEATFPETIYIPLSVNLPVVMLEDCESEQYRYTYHSYRPIPEDERVFLNYVIIQKRVAETAEEHLGNEGILWFESDYNNDPIFVNGDMVPYKVVYDAGIESRTWIIDIIKRRGYEYFLELTDFLCGNRIGDLHSRNIGYAIDGEPLIFDWLS